MDNVEREEVQTVAQTRLAELFVYYCLLRVVKNLF